MSATGMFSMGGGVEGSSSSLATQGAAVYFTPTVDTAPPLVSPYPAGQGLQTVNTALPSSAAFLPATYAFTATPVSSAPASSVLSGSTLLLLAALGAGAWFLLRKAR